MSASSLSPRTGLQESNGRAVISALKTLQQKIRSMEQSNKTVMTETGTNTPREPMTRKIARSKTSSICSSEEAQTASLIQISRSKELERELSLADERCRLLEERLDHMKQQQLMRNPVLPMPSCRSPASAINDENMELDEINFKFRLSPRSPLNGGAGINDENNSVDNFNERMRQLELLDEEQLSNSEFEVVRTTKKNDQINVKVQKKKIPFCAGKSATPSHNVGLNIQGLMHQLKTKNQSRPRSATATPTLSSSKGSSKLSDEIANLRKLLADLQAEFGDITLSCRRVDLDVDILQTRLESLEKKGQQILVIKKLLKKKEDRLRNEKKTTSIASSSEGTISSRQRPSEQRGRQNRQLLREVKKITNQL